MQLSKPFIRLPFMFDANQLAKEAVRLSPDASMPHPSGIKGNSAIALISRNGEDNDDFGGQMSTTRHLGSCPYHRQVIASFSEVLARSRLMKLDAGCEVVSHVDFNYHWHTRVRIHVPVITNPEVIFICGEKKLNMRAGECWIFDNWRKHNVINAGREDRVHLVVDLAGSSRFWKMVRRLEQFDRGDDIPDGMLNLIPFTPDFEPIILTERYNISPVMPPGEMDALIAELIRDFEQHPTNDPVLVSRYQLLLRDFAKDWREVWHCYGIQRDGIPHYQRLIGEVTRDLHPDRRALVTSSNDIGVNPIIMQRILRPALAMEVYDQFVHGAPS